MILSLQIIGFAKNVSSNRTLRGFVAAVYNFGNSSCENYIPSKRYHESTIHKNGRTASMVNKIS